MYQDSLFHEDIYDAIRSVVHACGGMKSVGSDLWPELSPDKAGERLTACLNRERREVLNPEQLLFLLARGREKGCHAAMSFISERCNYREPEPVEPIDEMAELQKEYIQSVKAQEKLITRMERMARLRDVS